MLYKSGYVVFLRVCEGVDFPRHTKTFDGLSRSEAAIFVEMAALFKADPTGFGGKHLDSSEWEELREQILFKIFEHTYGNDGHLPELFRISNEERDCPQKLDEAIEDIISDFIGWTNDHPNHVDLITVYLVPEDAIKEVTDQFL